LAVARLVEEALDDALVLGPLGEQHLERHRPADHGVLGAVDHAHAALTEQIGDLVVAHLLTDHATILPYIAPPSR
jgi:hypothetical protein